MESCQSKNPQTTQGSPIALAFFGLTVGAWAASSAFRPNNKDTFQDTACISIHFKASVEGCQNHPKSRECPWNKFGEFPTPSALKPTNYSPTRVQPVLSFNCTTQSGSSVNLVVCKCNSWQLWFNWLEPDMLWATWLQHKMFALKQKKNPGSSGNSKNIQNQGTNKTMHFCQSFPPSPLRTQVVTYSEAMIPMDWNSRRVPSRIERYQAPIGKLWGQGLENHNVQKKCGQSDFNS